LALNVGSLQCCGTAAIGEDRLVTDDLDPTLLTDGADSQAADLYCGPDRGSLMSSYRIAK
jgi:hypothetical protein